MTLYHFTKPEHVQSILTEGLMLERSNHSLLCPGRIYLCVNDKDWAFDGACLLQVTVPDEKIIWITHPGGNFNGRVLELADDVPCEWIVLVNGTDH